jgi:RHS repeat-associated protein
MKRSCALSNYTSSSGTVYSGSFLSAKDPAAPSGYPKAYLNWILLDDQFNYVSGSSGSVAAASTTYPANQMNTVAPGGPVVMARNGYLYVWVSNETQGWDVFFDNFSVQYKQGPVLEENQYYPYGLTMAGISDKAVKTKYATNKYRYNGKELQNQEFSDGTGLEEYDFDARFQNPQLGVWHAIDPLGDGNRGMSPYQYADDNPIRFIDPDGMEVDNPDVSEDANSVTFTGESAKEVGQFVKDLLSSQHAESEKETKQNGEAGVGNEGPKDGEKNKAGQVYNGDIKVWVSAEQYQNWQKLKAHFAQLVDEQDELDKKTAARQSGIDLAENYLIGSAIGLGAIITGGTAYEGLPWLVSLIWHSRQTTVQVDMRTKTLDELRDMVGGKNAALLRQLFGRGAAGAQKVLDDIKNVQVPRGLSRETLQAYRELINRVPDPAGTQEIRAKIIDQLLKQ